MEGNTIQEHAGRVIKRVRDWINTGSQVHKMQISKSYATEIEVHKSYLQSLIERLGKDNLGSQGNIFLCQDTMSWKFLYTFMKLLKK